MKREKNGVPPFKNWKKVGLARKDNPLILKELGYCYAKQGDFEKARDCYERVLQLEPEDSNAKKNLKILLETKTK